MSLNSRMKAIIEALKQKCLSSEEIEKVIISIKSDIKKGEFEENACQRSSEVKISWPCR